MEQSFVAFDFELFIEQRFKLGRAHYLTLLALALVQLNDGIQAITISLLTPILKEQLSLSSNQVSFLTSVFYIGVGVGALISGIQSNKKGRKGALLFGTLIQLLSSILLSFNFSYVWLCGCRLLYGIGFGSTLAVATVIVTELMPISIRGRTLLVVSFINSIGKLGGVGLAFVFINGQQKYLAEYMLASAFISLFALFFVCWHVRQSFRFLLFKGRYQQAWNVMNQIIHLNNSNADLLLTDTQKQSITFWSSHVFNPNDASLSQIKLLSKNKKTVILLSISWFLINIIFFGEMFIVPFMLGTKESGLAQYFWMTLGQIPTLLLTITLIQKKGWGRKTSLMGFFLGSSFFCLTTIWFLNSATLFFTKMLMKAIFQMLYPFTSQSYPTSSRSIGFAVNSFIGRVGATLMPFIIYPLYNFNPNSPFMFLALLCIFGALSINSLSRDTLQKALDEVSSKQSSRKRIDDELIEECGQQIEVATITSAE